MYVCMHVCTLRMYVLLPLNATSRHKWLPFFCLIYLISISMNNELLATMYVCSKYPRVNLLLLQYLYSIFIKLQKQSSKLNTHTCTSCTIGTTGVISREALVVWWRWKFRWKFASWWCSRQVSIKCYRGNAPPHFSAISPCSQYIIHFYRVA